MPSRGVPYPVVAVITYDEGAYCANHSKYTHPCTDCDFAYRAYNGISNDSWSSGYASGADANKKEMDALRVQLATSSERRKYWRKRALKAETELKNASIPNTNNEEVVP